MEVHQQHHHQQQQFPLDGKTVQSGGISRQTSSSLTFSREWLKTVAVQTLDIAQQGYYVNSKGQRVDIEEPLRDAVTGSVHYHSTHVFIPPSAPGPFNTRFFVCYGSALQVAAHLQGDGAHVGILNSASGKTPAKFLRGTISPVSSCARKRQSRRTAFGGRGQSYLPCLESGATICVRNVFQSHSHVASEPSSPR